MTKLWGNQQLSDLPKGGRLYTPVTTERQDYTHLAKEVSSKVHKKIIRWTSILKWSLHERPNKFVVFSQSFCQCSTSSFRSRNSIWVHEKSEQVNQKILLYIFFINISKRQLTCDSSCALIYLFFFIVKLRNSLSAMTNACTTHDIYF